MELCRLLGLLLGQQLESWMTVADEPILVAEQQVLAGFEPRVVVG